MTLGDLIGRQLESYLVSPQRLHMHGPIVALTPAAAQYLGMAFHELAANSLRHGVLGQPFGRLVIKWKIESGLLHVDWREQGSPPAVGGSEGFGRLVLERLAPQALEGKASWQVEPTGVAWHLACPLPAGKATV